MFRCILYNQNHIQYKLLKGDKDGNSIIWESWGSMPIKRTFEKALVGSVKDICW